MSIYLLQSLAPHLSTSGRSKPRVSRSRVASTAKRFTPSMEWQTVLKVLDVYLRSSTSPSNGMAGDAGYSFRVLTWLSVNHELQ